MSMPALRMGDMVSPRPIIQGGMGVGISLSGLAAAVARNGGIGVIATAGIASAVSGKFTNDPKLNSEALKSEVIKAKKDGGGGLIGCNIMVALADYDSLIGAALEVDTDVIFTGAGLPIRRPEGSPLTQAKGCKTKLVPKVSSAKALKIIMNYWLKNYGYGPDAVVVEGPECGGHIGVRRENLELEKYSLEAILPEVLQVAGQYKSETGNHLPVIAAGGIYTGADIHKTLKAGADAVKIATRFVTTHECDAHPNFKQAYLDSTKDDVIVIDSPLGMPGRALKGTFLKHVSEGERMPDACEWHCIDNCDYPNVPYCIALALQNAQHGDMEHGFAFAGSNAYRATELKSVEEVFGEIDAEWDAVAGDE